MFQKSWKVCLVNTYRFIPIFLQKSILWIIKVGDDVNKAQILILILVLRYVKIIYGPLFRIISSCNIPCCFIEWCWVRRGESALKGLQRGHVFTYTECNKDFWLYFSLPLRTTTAKGIVGLLRRILSPANMLSQLSFKRVVFVIRNCIRSFAHSFEANISGAFFNLLQSICCKRMLTGNTFSGGNRGESSTKAEWSKAVFRQLK